MLPIAPDFLYGEAVWGESGFGFVEGRETARGNSENFSVQERRPSGDVGIQFVLVSACRVGSV